jgi:hypothetical protein
MQGSMQSLEEVEEIEQEVEQEEQMPLHDARAKVWCDVFM